MNWILIYYLYLDLNLERQVYNLLTQLVSQINLMI